MEGVGFPSWARDRGAGGQCSVGSPAVPCPCGAPVPVGRPTVFSGPCWEHVMVMCGCEGEAEVLCEGPVREDLSRGEGRTSLRRTWKGKVSWCGVSPTPSLLPPIPSSYLPGGGTDIYLVGPIHCAKPAVRVVSLHPPNTCEGTGTRGGQPPTEHPAWRSTSCPPQQLGPFPEC